MSELNLQRSNELFREAQDLLPGGVSSPVRAFKSVGGTPLFLARGEGASVWDEDGNRYVDLCGSWGPLILGHAHADVIEAITAAARKGTSFGAPNREELELAKAVRDMQPLAERVRFVSSGTEAVMSAVRLARGFTGRDLVVKFDGCYHGHADYLLVKAGSGLATAGQPDSAGVPAAFAECTVVLPLNDPDAFRELMAKRGGEVACVLIEPLPANAGLLPQTTDFLRLLREETTKAGALLIFDEVISGFRIGERGMAGVFEAETGLKPDLLTYGKVIGGGLPVGAYAGRRDVMEQVAPLGPVYQAGTLSGNPVAMAAGRAALNALRGGGYARLEENARLFAELLTGALAPFAGRVTLVHRGSIFWIAFQARPPRAWHEVERAGAEPFRAFHRALLERGVYAPPSAFEVLFLSAAYTREDLEHVARAVGESLELALGGTP